MRTAILGGALLTAGAVAVACGVLPVADALALWDRSWPILLFVAAITVFTELSAEAGLFHHTAASIARWGRGRGLLLWLLVLALAVLSTAFLSLDTTAVLLTPVVVLLAHHAGLPPLPFALTTVWIANTGSLFLPVSNLTNLLAAGRFGEHDPFAFLRVMAVPAAVAVVVPASLLLIVHRRVLLARRRTGPGGAREEPVLSTGPARDPVLLGGAVLVLAALLPLLVSGLPVWIPAAAAALALGALFAWRRPSALRVGLLPWRLILLVAGLFLVVQAAHSLGLGELVMRFGGQGDDPLSLLRLAGSGALGANAVDNLPAYLALEPVADSPARLAALLIGVNAGPLITPWASLATLLWRDRLRALGIEVSWWRYGLLGLVAAPLTVVAATLALIAVGA